MNTLMKKTAVSMAVLGAALAAPVASADLSGNVAASSDYVWRGLTQTNSGAAVSGGIDYSAPFGLYVGTWASNTSFGSYEADLYAGFSKEFGPVGLDVGVIGYFYPEDDTVDDPVTTGLDESSPDFSEVYVGVSWKMLSAKVSYSKEFGTSEEAAMYAEVGAEFEVAKDLKLALHAGKYDFKADSPTDAGYLLDDYTDYSISLAKGDFTFTVSDTNLDEATFGADDDPKVYVTYAREFDLLK